MKFTFGKLVNLIVVLVLLQASAFSVFAAGTVPTRPDPTPASEVVADSPVPAARVQINRLSKDLIGLTDASPIVVSVRGTLASLSQVAKTLDEAGRLAYLEQVKTFQTELEKGIVANGGTVIYRYRTLGSGVIARIPGNKAADVARLPGVAQMSRPVDYQVDLSETVGFIGGDTLKSFGLKGKGVKVAILDSGLDYTHLAFGGWANPEAWFDAYYGNDPACYYGDEPQCAHSKAVDPMWADVFGPTALRVKGGFDWVGPLWPTYGPEIPDPNPIALAESGTHGTHVADIIGGLGYPAGEYDSGPEMVAYPAKGEGMAPEADLYAFTVCSAISTSCSGLAMLQGMDDAADLDDNPATIDPADVLNMSLGSNYGQPEDDSAWLTNELVKYGTIVVQSAGNGGDKPYIVGSPSTASGSISVAQTNVPSARQNRVLVNTPLAIAGDLTNQMISFTAEYYTTAITADVLYDNTDADTRRGCQADGVTPPAAWSGDGSRFAGKIVLINRGTCAASYKVANAQANGAVMVLISMVTAGAPVDFSYGGGTVSIPAFTITLANGNMLKGAYATPPMPAAVVTLANVTADPDIFIPLANTIATTSSRGPRNHDNKLKPDIGAPGASVSAIAGTGSEIAAFGGTSGAAPMVTGAMALLKDLFKDQQNFVNPQLSVAQYKALLMNSANNQIFENLTPDNPTGDLLPVARIGAGQVDLTHALKTRILAYDVTSADQLEWTGSLSFQYVAASGPTEIKRTLRILNLNPFEKTLVSGYQFRYAEDANGAVVLDTDMPEVTIPAGEYRDIEVTMTIDPSLLSPWFNWNDWWTVDRGGLGGNGQIFKQVEYDGYIWIGETLATSIIKETSVPFHVIPKPVADVTAGLTEDYMGGTIDLTNAEGTDSNTDLFNLVDESPNYWGATIGDCASIGGMNGCNYAPVDIKDVGYRMWQGATSSYIDFGISLWDNPYRAGMYPVELDVYIDTVHPQAVGSAAAAAPIYEPGPDGEDDYVVYFVEGGGVGASGQALVYVGNLHTGIATAYYYLDSTFDSNNYILTLPASSVGLSIPLPDAQAPQALVASQMNFYVLAWDAYFSGDLTDYSPELPNGDIGYHSVDVLADRWSIDMSDQAQTIEEGETVNVDYTLGAPLDWLASGSQIGFLAMYREAPIQMESEALVLSTHKVTDLLFLPILNGNGGMVDPYQK